jgi:hypothetical protein
MKKKAGKPKKTSVRIKDLRSRKSPKGGMRGNTIGGAQMGPLK